MITFEWKSCTISVEVRIDGNSDCKMLLSGEERMKLLGDCRVNAFSWSDVAKVNKAVGLAFDVVEKEYFGTFQQLHSLHLMK